MKAKKLLAAVLTLCLAFSCIVAIPVSTATVASADAVTATATTKALWVGPTTNKGGMQTMSMVAFPLTRDGSYGDGTTCELTFKVKMISGTKPYVGIYRAVNLDDGNSMRTERNFVGDCNNGTSYIDANGVFHTTVKFSNVPGAGNVYYSDYWNGDGTQTRYDDGSAAKWGVLHIGNLVHTDDNHGIYSGMGDTSMEFIISDVHLRITSVSGGNATATVGTDLAPSVANFDSGSLYSVVGANGKGAYNNAHNHPLNMKAGMWSAISTDEETVRQVTVDDDFISSYGTGSTNTRTYTRHAEDNYNYEYYTCSDFGSDVKFEKIGNVYSKVTDDDIVKRSIVIKSRAGDPNTISNMNDGQNVPYANVFIPLNIHKFYSGYNSGNSGTSSTCLTENGGNVRLKVSFKAKRISGTGTPIVSHMYSYAYATAEVKMGAPTGWPGAAYNNNAGNLGETKDSSYDWLSATYNAATGEYEAVMRSNVGTYKQMSRTGAAEYICIGTAEHNDNLSGFNSICLDTSFVISDVKVVPYAYNLGSTELFGGVNQAPKMTANNIDTSTTYLYFGGPNNSTDSNARPRTEYLNNTSGSVNCGMRHAPLNKYSVEGCVQNVTSIPKNLCNASNCSLTYHAATDSTREYYSCATHGKCYDDKYASNDVTNNTSATKKMIVVKQTGSRLAGAFIPLDAEGWVGTKTFIFTCKMKVYGNLTDGTQIPTISRYVGSYWGGLGGMIEYGATSDAAKDGSVTKWTHYDAATSTYTAAFTMYRSQPGTNAQPDGQSYFRYASSDTGANNAIMLGNFKSTGGQANPGAVSERYFTGFAFTDPHIYEATDDAAGTYDSSVDYCKPISDKTVNFGSNYLVSGLTQTNNSEWAGRGSSFVMRAPLNTWSKTQDGNGSFVYSSDIPTGFFANSSTPKMLAIGGNGGNYTPLTTETYLQPGKTYKLEFDYHNFGAKLKTIFQIATQDGTTNVGYSGISFDGVNAGYNDNHVDNKHYSIWFTMPSNARILKSANSGGGNFRMYLGQTGYNNDLTMKSGTVYFANFNLYRINYDTDATEGTNNLMNGSFCFGGNSDVYVTTSNFGDTMFGWDRHENGSGQPYVTTFAYKKLMNIPTGFFGSDVIGTTADGSGDYDLALKFPGVSGYAVYNVHCDLPAENATYELSFNYRGIEDDIAYLSLGGVSAGITLTDTGTRVKNGKFTRVYTITTTTAHGASSYAGDANTKILFSMGGYAASKEFYIANLSLRKKSGNSLTGANLIADSNPIWEPSTYYPQTHNTFTIPTDNNAAQGAEKGHGWFNGNGDSAGATCSVERVSTTFFNHYTFAERQTYMINHLIGKGSGYNPYADNNNPYYDPLNDASNTILDLIKIKRDALTANDAGGAGVEANALKNEILNSGNNYEASGSTVTISSSNSSSASSAVSGKKTIYIDHTATGAGLYNAVNSAGQNAIILLERGGEWRLPTGTSYRDGLALKDHQVLATYGTGAKPTIIGSPYNYATQTWTQDSTNIWKVKVNPGVSSSNLHDDMMPGLIYCYTNANDTEPALVGNHDKDAESKGSAEIKFNTKDQLTQDGDVYCPAGISTYESEGGYLYMYSTSNPATRFGRIEIGIKRPIIAPVANNITIDGIKILYNGGLGMNISNKNNVSITNCEIGYIGGAANSSGTQEYCFGNGIQFGNGGTNITVDHCYVYHCFDAGITFQSWSDSASEFNGVNFTNNLLTNNFYNIEFFTTGDSAHKAGSSGTVNGVIRNSNITGNIMRFAGETYSMGQRYDWLRCGNICVTVNAYYSNISNLKIQNNIFDCTQVAQIMWTWGGLDASVTGNATTAPGTTISGNTYYQKYGSRDYRVGRFGNITDYKYAGCQAALETAIAFIEPSPRKVQWINRADKY